MKALAVRTRSESLLKAEKEMFLNIVIFIQLFTYNLYGYQVRTMAYKTRWNKVDKNWINS